MKKACEYILFASGAQPLGVPSQTMAGPSRVLLKNTTKLSLNERFTAYRQQAEALGGLGALGAISAIGPLGPMGRLAALGALEQQQQQHQQRQQAASLRNLRLAQQMATRPSVLAALRLKKSSPPVTAQKRVSCINQLNVPALCARELWRHAQPVVDNAL